jgi:hypothetical protein
VTTLLALREELDRRRYDLSGGGISPPEDQPIRRRPKRLRDPAHAGATRVNDVGPNDLTNVRDAKPAQLAGREFIEASEIQEVPDAGRESLHSTTSCAGAASCVKRERATDGFLSDYRRMPPAKKPEKTSPVSDRIRARLAELRISETAASESMGWSRSVLSTLMRRLDRGEAGLRDDTVSKLEHVLGKPGQWIRTGSEPPGVRLADCPGWPESSALAIERWGISPAKMSTIGEGRLPVAVRYVDAMLIRAISDALPD